MSYQSYLPILLWNLALTLILLGLSLSIPGRASKWREAARPALNRVARHRVLAVMLVGLFALIISASVSLFVRMPDPAMADEFSYLLAADTFAHGRLTNPTHPLWAHFESIHIIEQPTYASKFPPGQGMIMALGQVVLGHPLVGVWLTTALLCGAICWMLQAWLPPRWALLGGLLAILHPLTLSWSQSYYGGALAAFGGALMLGAFRRMTKETRARDAFIFGLGMAILANCRPYEGMVFSLILLSALFVWMVGRQGPGLRISLSRICLPIALMLVLTAGFIGLYNFRVTGSAVRLPYQVHEDTYGIAPVFLWQSLKPEPIYRHQAIHDFQTNYSIPVYQSARRSVIGCVINRAHKIFMLARFFLFDSWAMMLPLIVIPFVWRTDRRIRFALLLIILFTIGILPETWIAPHYVAPALGLSFLLVLQSMRHLRLWQWRSRPIGSLAMQIILPLAVVPLFFLTVTAHVEGRQDWRYRRADILNQLKQDSERHLVVVRYWPNHSAMMEWVYNEADIDGAKVVWAREMDAARNCALIRYFKDRRVWLLEADAATLHLVPYPLSLDRDCSSGDDETPVAGNSSRVD